ncbi:hypothetical protein EN852_011285 [Mesorhizobium sp. M2E.F.Ca.ET.209.01.1.1]|uniref:COG3904 family protein n=1 Tax=Mesorhizobium sp. M2E.F.Ca.ET.209.01.1.1 TaxID=2500526 RepID=UPI000FDBF2B7|nr:hypothetical protein [Mesorhizobium sp. M2E.F.Ca.ET.209.01.1.1]TGS16181.1 hypothetical protein EN852_011285 [Mesorhizobium sp. M2E.F.Ca.ET.209.01.1.1]
MTTWLERFCLIAAAALFAFVVAASAAPTPKPVEDLPMTFALVRNGDCKVRCVQWISAEGRITTDSPRLLKKLLLSLKGQKLPVVFQSYGGSVGGAISVGRMIRAAGLETAIGRTQLNGCPMLVPRCPEKIVKDGWSEGEAHAGSAYCISACPIALAGGLVRSAAPNAYIALHQITNGKPKASTHGRRNLDQISAIPDPALRKMLSDYYEEMGVDSRDVFASMGLATPEGIHYIMAHEALSSGIITRVFVYSEEPGYVTGPSAAVHPDAPVSASVPPPNG